MKNLARVVAALCVFICYSGAAYALPLPPPVALPEPPSGNPIASPPAPGPTTVNNVTNVNVTPLAPDHFIATAEYDNFSVPVTWATGLLKADNIFTTTPWAMIDVDTAHRLRAVARNVALALFALGIAWTGVQLIFGQLTGTTTYQQILPLVIIGFFIAMYSDMIAHRAVDLCNWLDVQLGEATLGSFSGDALKLPEKPVAPGPDAPPGIVGVPAAFFSGLITTLIYAIVLLILELKLIFRDAILIVTTTVMPISGVLWAFQITRGWGVTLYRLFFGWLFGQPLVVVCLGIAGSLATFFNNVDGPAQVLVKLAVLLVAIKALTIFASGGLGTGGMFGLTTLLLALRQAQSLGRRMGGGAPAQATPATSPPANSPHVSGRASGTGGGGAATGRPWRPAGAMA